MGTILSVSSDYLPEDRLANVSTDKENKLTPEKTTLLFSRNNPLFSTPAGIRMPVDFYATKNERGDEAIIFVNKSEEGVNIYTTRKLADSGWELPKLIGVEKDEIRDLACVIDENGQVSHKYSTNAKQATHMEVLSGVGLVALTALGLAYCQQNS